MAAETSRNGSGRVNPVQLAFEQELARFVKYMNRKAELGPRWKKPDEEAYARGSNTLFNLWNNYESRLQQDYYIQKLIATGDFLFNIKEYKIAQYYCYGKFLSGMRGTDTTLDSCADKDMEEFNTIYLPNGLDDPLATTVIRALLGEAICSFHVKIADDFKLKNPQTITECHKTLNILRLITQTALHRESFCWLVFNGTVHMYTACRHLMSLGYSSKVLEFLLWACMCMESSVPLMTARYLTWRCTLYTAVCQCYYDMKATTQAESFAKRGLNKVNELEDIEKISTSETSPMSAMIFREARTKMQIMVFKRVVFETRKRPKGLLRPKTKPNLKDSINQPWPRTQTERVLTDLFQFSTSAQFLAILEALSESRRRTLHCEAPPPDAEETLTDVCAELFFAGMELIAGGGGPKHQHAVKHENEIHPSVMELGYRGLMGFIREGSNGIPLQAVIKFVKLAFSYEQWETFNILVSQVLELLRDQQNTASLLDIKTLELMRALEPFYSSIKKPKKTTSQHNTDETADVQTHAQVKNTSLVDDLLPLADVLHSCSLEPYKSIIGHMDMDMIIDTALFLWSKCKVQFQRVVSSSMEGCKYVLNDTQSSKWMYLITVVHTALSWSDACTFDPILFAEVALKLALVLECKANVNDHQPRVDSGELESPNPGSQYQTDNKQDSSKKKVQECDTTEKSDRCLSASSESSKYSSIIGLSNEGYSHGVRGLLAKACDVLNQGFQGIGRARDAFAQTNGKDIVDPGSTKGFTAALANDEEDDNDMIENMVKALHTELLFVQQRVSVKHAALGQDPESRRSSQKKAKFDKASTTSTQQFSAAESEILSSCDKNPLSKAFVLMHKAGCAVAFRGMSGTDEQTQLLKESMELIQKAQQQDRKLLLWNTPGKESTAAANDVPPPPHLVYRSPTTMMFKPAPFEPNNEKVAWYRLFARSASGNNIKVRLNDYQLPGTGEETPATSDCILMVKGLKPNQRYVFALAAYNTKGQIIGKTIGATSRPVLAAHSLPTLMAWGYLAQIAYTAGVPSVAKSACSVFWNHFVTDPKPSDEDRRIEKTDQDVVIRLKILDEEKLQRSSSVLIRLFLQSVFIAVDLNVRENFLYCNSLCDNGPLYDGQVARLHECERLLLAVQVAGWLNDTAMCLQAIVQCYGLLAPMVQQQIPAKPVIQILLRCHTVLQEVPSLTRHRRQTSATESLSHMIATMTYFIAKTLHNWGEKALSGAIVELGKKMLHLETAPDSANTMTSLHAAAAIATANTVGQPPLKTKKKLKPKLKGGRGKSLDKDLNSSHDSQNEELKSLEAYISKLSQKALHREDDELSGSEDPNILHSYVASLPAHEAYREVLKFKRRTRFLEFVVQVVGKAIDEGHIETSLEWSNDAMTWIIRRNEMVLANKPTVVRMAPTGQEDEKIKRFATAIVEFGKTPGKGKELDADEVRVRTKLETARPPQSKPKSLLMSLRRTGKLKGKTEEDITIHMAAERLQNVLPDYWRSCIRRKKLRSVSKEELPWKVQLNMMTAGCNLEVFLERLGAREKENAIYGPSQMDPDWFSFSTCGTLIISWAGTSRGDSPEQTMGFSGSVMEIPPYASPAVTTTHTVRTQHASQAVTHTDVGRSGSRVTAVTASDKESGAAHKSPLVYLGNAFSNLTRAIVLAHRGKYWTMLQNACRRLWNTTQAILIRVVAGSLRLTDDPQGEVKADIDILRGALWKPFFTAADCLMDMIVHLQGDIKLDNEQNKKHDKMKKGDVEITPDSGLMAGVEDEKGGSSLRFEIPLDNNTTMDMRWVKRLVLYAAEMMFYEGKWERVVDIILRFNALSRSRYAESLLPMVIVAQRKLAERVKQHNGPSASQPVIKVSKETGIAEEFLIVPAEYESIEPAVHLDPIGHDVYSGSTEAFRLISVPIDINESLSNLHEALDIKHHTARVLQHSRRLLLCYLAGQQKGSGDSHHLIRRGSSRVGFVPTHVKPPTDVPTDLTDQTYESVEDITTYTLQSSQLAVVISSYDKTIEMLQCRQQRGLAAQAMHELGNIMFHSGNIRMAYKWWAEALDNILITSDSLKNWRDIAAAQGSDINPSEVFLRRCGIWGCLLAALLASNIAQYVHTSNLGLRQECCLLSATFFKALFRTSLPHPKADKDYALYDVGSGFEVKDLLPGVDLLSDVFRSDGRSVVAALTWLTDELVRSRHYLQVLPLITLSLYFTSYVCRDLQRTVDMRILRARVLTDLGLYSQAIRVMCGLLHGECLPRTGHHGLRSVATKTKKTKALFANSKQLTDVSNLEVINELLEYRLSPQLVMLYGPQLSSRLKIAYAHLLITVAASIYAIPLNMKKELDRFYIEKAEAEAEAEENAQIALGAPPPTFQLGKKLGKPKKSEDTLTVKSPTLLPPKRIIDTDSSPEAYKGFLLSVAELILEEVLESVKDVEEMELEQDSFNISPSDLELLVLARMELSGISLQRYHAVTAGSLVYSAMRSLEDAAVLNELDTDKRSPSMFNTSPLRSISPTAPIDHFLTSQARGRLDARLWLTCRLALAKSLIEEDNGMGKLGGTARSVTARIGSCEHHCKQGIEEAEAFGDVEMAAEFGLLDFVCSLQRGKISDELVSKLEELIVRLERCQTLSHSGEQLLMLAVTQYADLNKKGTYANDLTHLRDPVVAYQQAASILIKQLINLGESVDRIFKSPVLPLQDIYLQQINRLVEIKLRLGRGLSCASVDQNSTKSRRWNDAVRELELGLELARVSAYRRKPVEAHILFSIGQVQRQMFNAGLISPRKAANSFIEAIQHTFVSDHDLGMMKQAYMEIAAIYLESVKRTTSIEGTPETQKESKLAKAERKETRAKSKKGKEGKEMLKEFEKEKRVVWSAVRAAALVSMAQHRCGLLTGDPEITALKMKKSGESLPSFALFDLLGTDDVVPSARSLVGKDGEVLLGTEVSGSNTVRVTWIQMLGYLSLLRRQCSYKALGVGTEDLSPLAIAPLFSERKAQKLSIVHRFLKSELGPYAEECCGVYPIDGLTLTVLPVSTETTEGEIVRTPTQKIEDPYKYFAVVQGMSPASARDLEVSVYWGQLLLGTQTPQDAEDSCQSQEWVFLFGLNNKAFNMASNLGTGNLKIGLGYLPIASVQALHEGLMNTLELAESELQPAPQANVAGRQSRIELSVPASQETKSPQSVPPARKKRTVGIRALSAKQRREDVIRSKLKEHLEQIYAVMKTPEDVISKEVPFEINMQNIACLEAIFDPCRGYTTKVSEAFFNWLSTIFKGY